MKILEMGKDMKIKHSVSSPPCKVWGNVFAKKLCMGEQVFLGKFMGGMFYMGTNDQIIQGASQWLTRFQRSS